MQVMKRIIATQISGVNVLCLDRPRRLQQVETHKIFSQWAHEAGMVVSPTQRTPLLTRQDPWGRPQGDSAAELIK